MRPARAFLALSLVACEPMPAPQVLRGRIDPTAFGVPAVRVVANAGADTSAVAAVDAEGRFALALLPGEDYRLALILADARTVPFARWPSGNEAGIDGSFAVCTAGSLLDLGEIFPGCWPDDGCKAELDVFGECPREMEPSCREVAHCEVTLPAGFGCGEARDG